MCLRNLHRAFARDDEMIGEYLFWIATTHLDDTDRIVDTLRVVCEEIDLDLKRAPLRGNPRRRHRRFLVRSLPPRDRRRRARVRDHARPGVVGRQRVARDPAFRDGRASARRPRATIIARSNASHPTNAPDVHAIVTTAYLVTTSRPSRAPRTIERARAVIRPYRRSRAHLRLV